MPVIRDLLARLLSNAETVLLVVTVTTLTAGALAWVFDSRPSAEALWAAGAIVAVIPAAWWVIDALRRGRVGVDVIAVLSLLGTLWIDEYLAGALIAVMLATGRTLDAAANRRATRDLRSLRDHVPGTAQREHDGQLETVKLDEIGPGDLILVGPGSVVPTDGWIVGEPALLDESALTGEANVVERPVSDAVRSGAVNAGGACRIEASRDAQSSTYAGIVRLAQDAAAESAPVVRLADRVAGWFLPATLIISGSAWAISDSFPRAVAVLVVATPCPLLLAAPVAIVSGLSRASRIGVIVRSGGALEKLGSAHTLVIDKTGTLTSGRPTQSDVVCGDSYDSATLLRLAASADQVSSHILAEAIVRSARSRGLSLSTPEMVTERPGYGVVATVDGRIVTVGRIDGTVDRPEWVAAVENRARLDGAVIAWVSIDGTLSGAILLLDPIRTDAPWTIRRLRSAGIRKIVMLTGDRPEPAVEVGSALGLDCVHAEQEPDDKVARVREESAQAVTLMVGDGINDAPALAAASVGIAMGARGATASSEAADVVLTTDRLSRVADAMDIARRSRRIALQSAILGTTLSLAAMIFAAFGFLIPAVGALLQELIDVAVILNALRALNGGRSTAPVLDPPLLTMLRGFSSDHRKMRDELEVIRVTAEAVVSGDRTSALRRLHETDRFLQDVILPHERSEGANLYPMLERSIGGADSIATMAGAHAEIERLSRRLGYHVRTADLNGEVEAEQVQDLLACLYGLYAVLRLHFRQEEQSYFVLADEPETEDEDARG
ncbi:heavy metal translocating P-type ATPase [Rhodococcus sp. AD45-ID]|uniref:heavy metal translocating P-type ATPase n=1 Tax=unclassified Rhodococcus (in: high G+C Gram-positive bacteria) TaxID=192944 RepID=UPI0005D34985|nr:MULTISPECIES: heavy metal translocating P-type ATPase [unclassified Rhodococcus (in: high G+C Gram-positive bacteria)]PSR40232.1 heavy metal translocating P-type ATPase [Rhodococcus sp. AD45-ID]